MIKIESIIESIKSDKIRITDHADEEAYSDGLSFKEIFASLPTGEIIEQYPDDKPYPSCLVFSKSVENEPIHSVWAYNQTTQSSVLITVYRPDPRLWIDGKVRRRP